MVKYTSIYKSIHVSRAQGERKDGDVIRIFRGLHGLLGCSAAGHSGDPPEVGFPNLGLSNPAVLLCGRNGSDTTTESQYEGEHTK